MLTANDIKTIVASGEGYNAEFKVALPSKVKEVTEEICAFANAAGGHVLLGVDDRNVIRGISLSNSERSALQNSIRDITPPLLCKLYEVVVDGKRVWVVEVPSGPRKPYALSGAIYVRQGSNCQKLTSVEEMRDFFQQSDRIYFDECPCQGFDPATDLDSELWQIFKKEAALSSLVEDEHIFHNLKLYTEEGVFKMGAVLFFGKNPEEYVEKAVIRCVAFQGIDKRFIIDDKLMSGPLYKQYLQAMEWLKGKLSIRYEIEGSQGGPRKEEWEIPQTIFKEALINSLSHRDYYDRGGRITVELFDDRVEIANPGGLVSAISKEDFGKRSHSRNPLLFGLFERMRMVEQIGSGVSRMKELMKEKGLPIPQFGMDGLFTVELRRPFAFDKWFDLWKNQLSPARQTLVKAIHHNPTVSKSELEAITGLSRTAVDKNLDYLKKIGLLHREGADRGGQWLLVYQTPGGG